MASKDAPRYVLASFQAWQPLVMAVAVLSQLPDFNSQIGVLALLRSFSDPAFLSAKSNLDASVWRGIDKMSQLTFQVEPAALSCSDGPLARQLARRIEQGCASFSEALCVWMTSKQASRLAQDVGQGQILLWVRLLSPEQERQACEVLLVAGPLRVEVHDLVPLST